MLSAVRTAAERLSFAIASKIAPDKLHGPVANVYRRDWSSPQRALLVYRTLPFRLKPGHTYFRYHQSMRQSLLIGRVLDELGFLVDVVDYTSPWPVPSERYNLVISHDFSLNPSAEHWKDAIRVYLASGTEHRLHNIRQRERLEAFTQRRGYHTVELRWDSEEMPWTDQAHAIFCFGNESIADTWRHRFSCPVFAFANTAFPGLECASRDWALARKHFLFLGSGQQLAKGLDLLLEAFDATPDLHLYVCGHYLKDRAFCQAYADQLFNRPNIHSVGWIDLTSRSARGLASNCAFTVSATCAEGSPGSLTNAMRWGLIPLISDYAGVDQEPGIPTLGKAGVCEILQAVVSASNLPAAYLKSLSAETVARAEDRFSESTFMSTWKRMLTQSITSQGGIPNNPEQPRADRSNST